MVACKTDWKSTDFFNLTDYTRITGNLAEAFSLTGLSPPSFRTLTVGAILQQDDRRKISEAYNRLSDMYGGDPLDPEKPRWFSYAELNRIEHVCMQAETAYHKGQRYGAGLYFGAGATLGGGAFG